MTARKTVFWKIRPGGQFAAVLLLAFPSLMCAQSSQPSSQPAECNMDSDGFCIAGAVQASPRVSSASQIAVQASPRVNSASQINVQVELSAAPESKLKVEFRDNLLRIDAENATLRDTLKAVSAHTGAEMRSFPPGGVAGTRLRAPRACVATRDVVSQLLNGVPFNYGDPLIDIGASLRITRLILSRTSVARESAVSETPASWRQAASTMSRGLHGAAFGVDPDAPASEPLASQVPAAGASPNASWVHTDGPKLSGEALDQMPKRPRSSRNSNNLRSSCSLTTPAATAAIAEFAYRSNCSFNFPTTIFVCISTPAWRNPRSCG